MTERGDIIRKAIGAGIPWHDPHGCEMMGCTDDHEETAAKEALLSMEEELTEAIDALKEIAGLRYPENGGLPSDGFRIAERALKKLGG